MSKIYDISVSKQQAIVERMQQLGIFEKDLEEQFIRGSGAGGQKKNKTSNCVLLKHVPTGVVVRYNEYRERSINQILARRALCEKVERLRLGKSSGLDQKISKKRKQKKRRARRSKKESHLAK